jgi:2,4-dienoyl-CoA reductase-like NADH-dependent reductase (Old Yellow Enzyme family)
MTDPFAPCQLGRLALRNRIVMAPMTRRLCAPGHEVSEASRAYYGRRARGGVGLILSEGVHIDDTHSWDTDNVPRIATAGQISAWARVADSIHAAGGRFGVQLWHTGVRAWHPIGPSPMDPPKRRDGTQRPPVRPMTEADMDDVAAAFARAARASVEAGADAVEVHAAHGYLLDSFLSPATNQRTDAFGGDWSGRLRFPCRVVADVRAAVPAGFPVWVRISQWAGEDPATAKFRTREDVLRVSAALRDAGADVLHCSTRQAVDTCLDDAPGGGRPLAQWVRELSGAWTVAVGSVSCAPDATGAVTDPGPALSLVRSGACDLLAVGRSLIANPDWVEKVASGRWRELTPYSESLLKDLT